ncbi:MAG: SUKH-4 family immunity protein [Caulobacter sp.]|nr:SUKH-4 family immunity protein [Caulobacter sp.]
MTPVDFKRLWEADGTRLCPVPFDELSDAAIPKSTREFLVLAGLPEDAAPFLSFDAKSRGHASDPIRLAMNRPDLVVVGANGSGDPIAVHRDGTLVSLNHGAGFLESYINRDVETFAEAALRMRTLVGETQGQVGPDAYLDGLVPAALADTFRSFLSGADPRALEPGALWAEEIGSWAAAVR